MRENLRKNPNNPIVFKQVDTGSEIAVGGTGGSGGGMKASARSPVVDDYVLSKA